MRELVGNRFECVEEIGRGAESIVFRGIDQVTGASVAVKLVATSAAIGFRDISQEISARRKCESRYVVPPLAWGTMDTEQGRLQYIVTPFLEGETLEARLRKGISDEEEAVRIAAEVAGALQGIHEAGFFHSDLKPSNIFFTTSGELKLLDFGLARGFQQGGISGGTACYAAPEQLLGQECDGRADLYALGCILYEIVSGRPPFSSDDLAEVLFDQVNTPPVPAIQHCAQLSRFLNAVILSLLEKSPEARFQSAIELRQALEAGESGPWWVERWGAMCDEPTEVGSSWKPSRPWQVPLVGRRTEVGHLNDWVGETIERKAGCFIVLSGAAGVGKTRLIEEVMVRFGDEAIILSSRCIKFDTRVPYLPLIGLVEDLVRREKFDGGQALRFQRFLTRHLGQTPLLVPKFMDFLAKQTQAESGGGALTTDNLLYLFTSLFHHMATESPVILFIDDLHWAEPSTCNFLRYFVRNIGDVPLAVLGGYRPEELVSSGEAAAPPQAMFCDLAMEPNFETLNVGALSARESQELVTQACGPAVGSELGPLMYRKVEGNPCYLFESIALLKDRGVILGEGAESRVASSISEISIPATVAELLKSRLGRLSEGDRELVEYASIQGPTFRSDVLMQPGEGDQLSVLRRLASIEREHRLIRSRESGYSFDHHLLYEYIYQSIAPDLRAAYHRRVAERMAASEAEGGEETVYALADHYSKGGDHARATEYLLKAARLSMAKYSGAEAFEALKRAREHFGKLGASERSKDREWEIALMQADIASHLGNHGEEEEAVEEIGKLAGSFGTPEKSLEASERRADFSLRVSRFEEALEGFNTARETARALGDERRLAKLTHRIGTTYREMMRWDDAMRCLEEASRLAASSGDSHLAGHILKDIATVKTKQTKWREATADYSRALPLLREAGDRREEGFALNGLAVSLFCSGEQKAALDRWEEANRIFESIGYPSGQANILHNLGVTYSNLGQMDRAIECLRAGLRLRQSIGMRHAQVSTLTRLGFVHFVVGAYDAAAENLRSALTIAREIGAELNCIEIYYHFMELAIAQGDLKAAEEHIGQAWKIPGASSDEYHRAHLKLAEAMLALNRGEWGQAAARLEEAEGARVDDPQLSSEIFIHQAWAAEGQGRSEDADRYAVKYREFATECPFMYSRITGAMILGTIYGLRGDEGGRETAMKDLREELERMQAGITDQALREGFAGRWGSHLCPPL